ncbi:MAG: N-acetyl-gamma-glutamyl-phosphate reductase [Trueperaceae bacterium]|nr:N-acetyl-gamma-glutamyl-phosphate reductase [Trueperaceae bacterium]
MSVRAAVLGAAGYGGAGLVRRLRRHPEIADLAYASRQYAGRPVADAWPHLAGAVDGAGDARFVTPDDALDGADVAFLATPHGATAPWVRAARAAGVRVVDLSADSRLDAATYAAWYGEHPHPSDLEEARYALVEADRDALPGAALLAAPGCNATAVTLALLPFAARGDLAGATPVCTVLAGTSGAGRHPSDALHHPELAENARAYKPAGTHRHLAEIEGTLGLAAAQGAVRVRRDGPGAPLRVSFTPHLIPTVRGILATCTFPVAADVREVDLARALRDAYADAPLVHVQEALPDLKAVVGSDRAMLSVRLDAARGLATAFAAIDNLGKGAAGQAVQAFNVATGVPETTGLALEGRWP